MRSREKHWREEQGGPARRSEEPRLSLSAAVTQKIQDVRPACASELQRRGLGEATGFGGWPGQDTEGNRLQRWLPGSRPEEEVESCSRQITPRGCGFQGVDSHPRRRLSLLPAAT